MYISNRFAVVSKIQIVIRMLKISRSQYYKFECGGYLTVKLDLFYK